MKEITSLSVSEKFFSIQGEGATMGIPAVFIRLSGCNLLCQSESWVCDTIEVWRKGNKTNFKDVIESDWIAKLKTTAHLVITGGEPLLHQKPLIEFLIWFKETYGWLPFIEIETNGTISPDQYLLSNVNQWNCSPKLSNSGETFEKRFKPVALELLNQQNTIFKFVIANQADIDELSRDFNTIIDTNRICLMPAGESQELLAETRLFVANKCVELGLRYSDRLHIVIWNKKTGV